VSSLELAGGLLPGAGAAVLAGAATAAFLLGALRAGRGRGLAGRLAVGGCYAVAAAGAALVLLRPTVVTSSSRETLPRVVVLVDRSASMREADLAGGKARWEAAARLLAPEAEFRRLLDARCSGTVLGFAGEVHSVDAAAGGGGAAAAVATAPDGDASDLVRALESGLGRIGPGPLAALVLITDGRVTRGMPLAAGAGRLLAARVPVWAVGTGDEAWAARPRISLPVLDVPESAVLGETVRIEGTVRASGLAGRRLAVRLLVDGREAAVQEFVAGSREVRLPASFRHEARAAGVQLVEMVAEAPDAAGAPAVAPARAGRYLVVRARALRVLYAEGSLGWGYGAMAASLGAAPLTEVATWPGFMIGPDGRRAERLDLTGRLAGLDVLVLGALGAADLEGRSLTALTRAVREDGLGLLLCPDPAGAASFAGTPLDPLLPTAAQWVNSPAARRRLALPAGPGERPALLRLDPSQTADYRMWSCLPETSSDLAPGALRPGARVLLQAGADPALVAWQAGRGRVAVMAWPDHWKWARSGEAGADGHRRLFSRLAAWLAGREETGGGKLALSLSRYRVAPGEELSLLAVPAAAPQQGALRLTATVSRPGGEESGRAMAEVAPGCYRLVLRGGPQSGEHRVRVVARADGADWAEGELLFGVEAPETETADPAPDFAALRRLAVDSGGAFLTADEADGLAGRMARALPQPAGRIRSARQALWDGPGVLAVALAALCAGWWLLHRMAEGGRKDSTIS
jgi:hypothetical protein